MTTRTGRRLLDPSGGRLARTLPTDQELTMAQYACHDCDTTFDAPTDTETAGCPGCGEMAVRVPVVPVSPPPPDQTAVEERVARRLAGAWISEADWQRYPASFRAEYLAYARDVLAFVPQPEPDDRAAVLREEADRIDATRAQFPIAVQNGITWATAEMRRHAAECPQCGTTGACNGGPCPLRRLAAEAQQPDTETQSGCPDPIECSHEAALGEAEAKLDTVHALAQAWSRPSMSAPTRVAGQHLMRLLNRATPEPQPDHRGGNADDCPACIAGGLDAIGPPYECPGPERP